MGTLTIRQVAERAWTILNDTKGSDGVRWPSDEMLLWHNDGQRAVVNELPSAYMLTPKPGPVLQAGTHQTLGGLGLTDGVQIISAHANVNPAGTAMGRSVTAIPKRWLDERIPAWHSATPGEVMHFCTDADDPKSFFVYPPPVAGARLLLTYAAVPPNQNSINDAIALDDIYANCLQYYMLFRSFGKSANYTKSPQQSTYYYQLFLQSLGIRDARVKALDANMQMAMDGAGVAGPES
jgi:hypothetical protein